MSRHKQRSQMKAIGEINVVPLLDTTLFLLIIFMITFPLLECSVDVSPPELTADPIPTDENNKVISLDKNGKITFNKRTITLDELRQELVIIFARDKKTPVLIRADGNRKYNEVMEIMKVVKLAGFKNVSLITLAE